MREIIFRGKRKYNGEWVEGNYGEYYGEYYDEYYNEEKKVSCISIPSKETISGSLCYDVIPETVGQYTGLTDKNGLTKIFEYDIIDANGRKVGNYYENSNLLKDGTCFLVAKMGTKEWSRSEQEAIKRGCKYAE